jgi:outer membrane murein-binding lipoprotein Lpp
VDAVVKVSAAAAIVAAVVFSAGVVAGRWTMRASAEIAPIARATDTLDVSIDSLDTSIDRARPADSAAVAEPERAAGVHLQHAESVGDSVTLLKARTDSLMRAAATSDSSASLAIAALADERAARDRQVDDLQRGAADLQRGLDSAKAVIVRRGIQLEAMRIQRDKARALLGRALAANGRKCGWGGGLGAGYAARGLDAGLFAGYVCRL